jgi:ribosomal protein S18 acetylase RimI-like enzyme
MTVRAAVRGDVRAIARVHVATWRTAYRGILPDDFLASLSETSYEERWTRIIGDGTTLVYVAEENDEIVGFASAGLERSGKGGELYAIYVLKEVQGRGHGRALVRAVVEGLRGMDLAGMIVWVLRDNQPALHFYERLGGVYVKAQQIAIGSTSLEEVSYGWRRLDDVMEDPAGTA